jgi:pimeloyl-ACP methyl ester carboxylesterase
MDNKIFGIAGLLILAVLLFGGIWFVWKKFSEGDIAKLNKGPDSATIKKIETGINVFQSLPRNNIRADTVENFVVEIRTPPGAVTGDLLILPGWNFSRSSWCENSSLCEDALQRGYRLIFPEMGKSIYQTKTYPETDKDLLKYPDGNWLNDMLIPYLQRTYNILPKGGNNFIIGLSTGGRGVALTVIHHPDLFKAAASLSGDFDQTTMQDDRLMTTGYGPYTQFPERWRTIDNPTFSIDSFHIPVYLGQGMKDQINPPDQPINFAKALRSAHPDLNIVLHTDPNADHDYNYWNSEVIPVLGFFEKYKTY